MLFNKTIQITSQAILGILLVLTLAACGGGGGNNNSSAADTETAENNNDTAADNGNDAGIGSDGDSTEDTGTDDSSTDGSEDSSGGTQDDGDTSDDASDGGEDSGSIEEDTGTDTDSGEQEESEENGNTGENGDGDGSTDTDAGAGEDETPEHRFASKAELGEQIFSDPRFSFNGSHSCATCHNPDKGFIDDRDNNVMGAVSLGDDGFSLGNRNSPTVSYAALAPDFSGNDEGAQGGQFHDGRAVDLRAQAGEPFLNPLEMGMPDRASVIARLTAVPEYVAAFREFYNAAVLDNTDTAYEALTDSIAVFQESDAVSPFDSKYDRSLRGEYTMTNTEQQGMDLFFSNRTSCLQCHQVDNLPNRSAEELFTSHRYFNIGVPANAFLNSRLQSLGQQDDLVNNGDQGLFANPAVNNNADTRGLFKVPTLRNIAVTAPYMHNGVFANLQTVLHFYDHQGERGRGNNGGNNNRRPTNPETGAAWGDAEVNANISNNRLRMPPLNDNEVDALECFLRTLTDEHFEDDLPALRANLSC